MSSGLSQVVPWGRSFDEYRRMFALGEQDLASSIAGCGDGPAGFNTELTRRGGRVVSFDPIYRFSAEEIARRIAEVTPIIMAQTRATSESFLWHEFSSPEALCAARFAAMEAFLADFPAGAASGRYVVAELPRLPVADGAFDLALCSHYLFTYSQLVDAAAHLAAVNEMLRVARRVRVFPLLDRFDGGPSPHVEPIVAMARARGWKAEVRPVPYEFQRGGNQMLEITRT